MFIYIFKLYNFIVLSTSGFKKKKYFSSIEVSSMHYWAVYLLYETNSDCSMFYKNNNICCILVEILKIIFKGA